MIKALSIAAAIAAFAGSASAAPAEIRVSLVGKDEATIHADILRAAKQVCRPAHDGVRSSYQTAYQTAQCVALTVSAAEAQIREAMAVPAKAPDQLASAR